MPKRTSLSVRRVRRIAAGLALTAATAVTVAGAATGPAGAARSHNPYGSFGVSQFGQNVHVWGWAADPDTRRPINVMISIPGYRNRIITTRPAHGWATWVRLPYGYHHISARALNAGPGSTIKLGAKEVLIRNLAAHNPHGTAWLTRYGRTVVSFTGRTADPDARSKPLLVRLWHNGHLVYQSWSHPSSKRYAVWSRLAPGWNSFTVKVVNRGLGTGNPQLLHTGVSTAPTWVYSYHGNRRIAAEMLPRYGWGPGQMRILDHMWYLESHWLTRAANPSGAYGIPQAYPGYKMASAGADWRSNPATQIRWGLTYIKQRYGSPAAAWNARETVGSY